MRYLTLDLIHAQLRIDNTLEDALLTTYAEAAEAVTLAACNTTYEAMIEEYEEIPAPIIQATLMLVDLSYQQRSPISQANLYAVPYTYDFLIKPYMILTYPEDEEDES